MPTAIKDASVEWWGVESFLQCAGMTSVISIVWMQWRRNQNVSVTGLTEVWKIDKSTKCSKLLNIYETLKTSMTQRITIKESIRNLKNVLP